MEDVLDCPICQCWIIDRSANQRGVVYVLEERVDSAQHLDICLVSIIFNSFMFRISTSNYRKSVFAPRSWNIILFVVWYHITMISALNEISTELPLLSLSSLLIVRPMDLSQCIIFSSIRLRVRVKSQVGLGLGSNPRQDQGFGKISGRVRFGI